MANVTVQKDRYTTDSLYQWDKNQELKIYGLAVPSIPEIHFTNDIMDKAIVRQATKDDAGVITVDIPNSLLQKPYKIRAYVCVYEGDSFRSLYLITIPVEARNKPNDYTIEVTDDEVYSFNALENLVNNTVNTLTLANEELRTELNVKYDELNESVNKKYNETNVNLTKKYDDTKTELNAKYNEAIAECEANFERQEQNFANDVEVLTDALNNRVDNIIAHNNDTEGNTELIDIRLGADGITYDLAGEAVRTPIENISGKSKNSIIPYKAITKNLNCGLVVATKGDGIYIVNGNVTNNSSYRNDRGIPLTDPFTLDAGTYTLSIKTDGDLPIRPYIKNINGTDIVWTSLTVPFVSFTLDDSTSVYLSFVSQVDGVYVNEKMYIQLEKGTVATDWVKPITANDTIARELVETNLKEIERIKSKHIDLPTIMWTPYGFKKQAHRGMWSTSAFTNAQNTIGAFTDAGQQPYIYGIETDVQQTSDGVFVCYHDADLSALTNGTGTVADHTWAEVQEYEYNSGSGDKKICSFEDYLKICRRYGKVPYIELKILENDTNDTTQSIINLLEIIKSFGFENRCIFTSFTLNYLTKLRELTNAGICEYMLYASNTLTPQEIVNEIEGLPNMAIRLNVANVTESVVNAYHNLGYLVDAQGMQVFNQDTYDNLLVCGIEGCTCNDWSAIES